jgi:hypothetical protein
VTGPPVVAPGCPGWVGQPLLMAWTSAIWTGSRVVERNEGMRRWAEFVLAHRRWVALFWLLVVVGGRGRLRRGLLCDGLLPLQPVANRAAADRADLRGAGGGQAGPQHGRRRRAGRAGRGLGHAESGGAGRDPAGRGRGPDRAVDLCAAGAGVPVVAATAEGGAAQPALAGGLPAGSSCCSGSRASGPRRCSASQRPVRSPSGCRLSCSRSCLGCRWTTRCSSWPACGRSTTPPARPTVPSSRAWRAPGGW